MKRRLEKLMFGCAIAGMAVMIAIVAFLLAVYVAGALGYIPTIEARPAGRIPNRVLRELVDLKVIEHGETVLYFYSNDLFDITKDGNLFTDRRIVSYQTSDDGLELWSAMYDEVQSMDMYQGQGWFEDSSITVDKDDGESFVLYVSREANGDQLFFARLMIEWKQHREKHDVE